MNNGQKEAFERELLSRKREMRVLHRQNARLRKGRRWRRQTHQMLSDDYKWTLWAAWASWLLLVATLFLCFISR